MGQMDPRRAQFIKSSTLEIAYSAALAVAGGCAPPYLVGEGEEEDDSTVAAAWIGDALRAEEVKGSCVEATLAAIAIFVPLDCW